MYEFQLTACSTWLAIAAIEFGAVAWLLVQRRRWERSEKELSRSEQRFRATFHQVAIGMAQIGLDGKCLLVNERLSDILGYSEDELINASLADLIHPCVMEAGKLFSERFLMGDLTPGSIEVRYCHKSGRSIWVNSCTSLVRNSAGQPEYGVLALEDVTSRKSFEEQLVVSNGVLRQFAYAAAHELQEPLRNVAISSELLAIEMKCRTGPGLDSLIEENSRSAKRMLLMVRDLLAFAGSLDSDPPAIRAADSKASLAIALSNLQPGLEAVHAKVTQGELPPVAITGKHLIHVFQNLISNAIKYGKDGEPLVMSISAKPSGASWTFQITDNGIGFEQVYGKKIFGLFKQLDRAHEHAGTGIGLAICARIIEYYGGTIWAESQPGAGATFYFTLPEVAAPHEQQFKAQLPRALN